MNTLSISVAVELLAGIAAILAGLVAAWIYGSRYARAREQRHFRELLEEQSKQIAAAYEAARRSSQDEAAKLRDVLSLDIEGRYRERDDRLTRLQEESERRAKQVSELQARLAEAQKNTEKSAPLSALSGTGVIAPGPPSAGSSISISSSAVPPSSAAYVEEIELTNIRCFRKLKISLAGNDGPIRRVLLLGDNASGKSTVLRAIALALCNESDAVSLMTTWPGSLIRNGADSGEIRLVLRDSASNETQEILKKVERNEDGSEILRHTLTLQSTRSSPPSIFVCGYGTQRTRAATASVGTYSPRQAVSTLFDEGAPLQNPELVLLRHLQSLNAFQESLMKVLLLDSSDHHIDATEGGLNVSGPWGSVPFTALSDGYRSTLQWLVDLAGWLVHAGRLRLGYPSEGILLIDEVEQHLHPRWQRYVMTRLVNHLPGMQVICTTHTPLVASGLSDVESGTIVSLGRADQSIEPRVIDPAQLRGKRADQVLTELFELVTTRNPGSSDDLIRMVHLRSLNQLTSQEAAELSQLEARLEPGMTSGETEFERTVDKAIDKTLDTLIEQPPGKALEAEVKRQLRQLLGDKGTSQ